MKEYSCFLSRRQMFWRSNKHDLSKHFYSMACNAKWAAARAVRKRWTAGCVQLVGVHWQTVWVRSNVFLHAVELIASRAFWGFRESNYLKTTCFLLAAICSIFGLRLLVFSTLALASGAASPKRFWGPICLTLGEQQYFCLWRRFAKHKMTRCAKNWGTWPPGHAYGFSRLTFHPHVFLADLRTHRYVKWFAKKSDSTASPLWKLAATWKQICLRVNHLTVIKTEASRLIPRRLAEKLSS